MRAVMHASRAMYIHAVPARPGLRPFQVNVDHNPHGLKAHSSAMAASISAELYSRLCRRVTLAGVTLDRCIKAGVENAGHPLRKTMGLYAGDADCYKVISRSAMDGTGGCFAASSVERRTRAVRSHLPSGVWGAV